MVVISRYTMIGHFLFWFCREYLASSPDLIQYSTIMHTIAFANKSDLACQ
jgi:hypothetical protein